MNTKHKRSLGFRLAVLHRLYTSFLREHLAGLGLQASEIPYITTLLRHDTAMSQDEISEILAIDKAASARTIARLEQKGFINRKINPRNRRQNLISAAPSSRKIESSLFRILASPAPAFLRGFSPEESRKLESFLDRMIENAMREKNEHDK